MKRLLVLVVILMASVWLGLQMQKDSGYVSIAYGHWALEMSIWTALIGLLITFAAVYALIKLARKIFKVGATLQRWKRQQKMRACRHLTKRGLIALAEGAWIKAEKNLIRSAKYSDMSLINYLSAAKAAQAQGNWVKRDEYLHIAITSNPTAQVAVGLTQARLQLNQQEWEQALATLTNLLKQEPNNIYAYQLLKQVYLQLGDWNSLAELIPILRKYQAVPTLELDEMEANTYCHKLHQTKALGLTKIQTIWQKIPRNLRKLPSLIQCYSELLIEFRQMEEATVLIQESLKKQWNNNLVRLYGLTHSAAPDKQLKVAEDWLAIQPNNSALLLCLGRLASYNQLWGKARSYFEASIAEQASPETYAELAKLLEKIEQSEDAMRYYREGLLLMAKQGLV
jgi:HemY protein